MKLKLLTPSDYAHLKQFFDQQKYKLCAYSLPSVLVWASKIYQPCGTITDDRTLIVGVEFNAIYEEKRHLILPISPVRDHSPAELRDIAVKAGFSRYSFVPADYIEKFGWSETGAFFEIKEHPELHDYIYFTDDLATLPGNKYSKKRNLIHQFEREYADRVQVEKITSATASECTDFLEKWCEERDCVGDPEGLSCEKQAAINALENTEILEMNGILLRVDNVVSAFGIASHITDEMGALHFEKAFSHIKGLYQFFDNFCAKHLFKGYKYINKESDMGVPGIAKAKKSYHPVMIIKSYDLTVR
ncbi:MAG: hypothetical protein DRI57_13895 [Deltaproteobacteria bacterium]|nr:MAG: hypothetical protein DRI57_13895 [Deltaproteobacteria bacterium]